MASPLTRAASGAEPLKNASIPNTANGTAISAMITLATVPWSLSRMFCSIAAHAPLEWMEGSLDATAMPVRSGQHANLTPRPAGTCSEVRGLRGLS